VITKHWCAVDELYRYWIDRLNVAEDSTLVMEDEEAWDLKGFLEESRDEHLKEK
jgi:5'(3')-deoxyribonucleotidase